MPMPFLSYTPLPPDGASIRLLRLQPSSDNDAQIQCKLLSASIEEAQKIPYEALSYTWGDATQTSDIEINGANFPATVNLEGALRALRKPDEPRTLWVDAVCINQSDLQEQGSQVKMMWDIYKNAERVLVWLGPEEGDSAIAMEDMTRQTTQERISQLVEKRITPSHYNGKCDCSMWDVEPPPVGIHDVLGRQWFTRVWVGIPSSV